MRLKRFHGKWSLAGNLKTQFNRHKSTVDSSKDRDISNRKFTSPYDIHRIQVVLWSLKSFRSATFV